MSDIVETVIQPITNAVAGMRDQITSIATPLRRQARSGALAYLDEQKQSAAHEVSAFADIVRRAAQPQDGQEASPVAGCATQFADRIDEFAGTLRDRSAADVIADTEALARREPALFLLGAVAVGFLLGFLLKSPDGATAKSAERYT
ncbi:MAG TPA: hypothetical protein VHX39_06420 [Acetobacteraceae bacterium]|jgi:hypothetical protein|nr:hypothetical protein [Acetobacteraceae bacterium]